MRAVRLDLEREVAELRQLSDALEIVGHLAERVLDARIDLVRDAGHRATTRNIDKIRAVHEAEVHAARAARGDRVEIRLEVRVDAEVRREVVRRAAADDAERQVETPLHHEVDNLVDRAVAARDEQAVRIHLAHERDKGLIALPARAVEDDEDAAALERLDDPVKLVLEGSMPRNRIVEEHELLQSMFPLFYTTISHITI